MPDYDLILRGGQVVSAEGTTPADVAMLNGRVAAVGPALPGRAPAELSAHSCLVLPGFIDPHVHLSLPIGGGLVSSDDWASGTRAAACGGTTTIIDFTTQERGGSLDAAVVARRRQADGQAVIDYGLHLTVMDAGEATLASLTRLTHEGCPSLKLYMTYGALMARDETILRILDVAAACGALSLVHAENHDIISHLTARLLAEDHRAPSGHPLSRPDWVEAEATHRAIALARAAAAPLYVVHVSCAEALAAISHARLLGQTVYAETCPHYLLLSDQAYALPGFEGAKFVMTPPLRPSGNWQPLWRGLADGAIDVIATDHCPWLFAGQKSRGRDRFDLIPGGIAGVETRGALLFSEGVVKRRLSLEKYVEVMSANPARLFGLYPRKGALAPGSDADIVVFDPRREGVITQSNLHSNVDYTAFEGWRVTGAPVLTLSRGVIVAREGQFVGPAGHGRFIARDPHPMGGAGAAAG